MSNEMILLPVLAHMMLVFVLYNVLKNKKIEASKTADIDFKKAALDNQVWTDDVLKVSNNVVNQFEAPMLFYVLCIMLYVTSHVGIAEVVLAWVYFLLRLMHVYIHTGSNVVMTRMKVFVLSMLVLMALWGCNLYKILL